MWRKGFTFKVQTPHLKFGSGNDSCASTVFFSCGSNQTFLWIRLRPTFKTVNLTEAAAARFILSDTCDVVSGVKMNDLCLNRSIHTVQKKRQLHLTQIDPFPCPRAEKAVPVPLHCVWFSIWFLAFLRFASQLFVFGFLCVFCLLLPSAKTVRFFI